jgi:Flp pilus assembly protein TadG
MTSNIMCSGAGRLLGGFMRSARAATLPMMAAGLIPMIAAIGGAIDIGRIYIVKSQMQAGADAAALAAANAFDNASESDENGRYKQAVYYYSDNLPNGYMGLKPGSTPGYSSTETMQKPSFAVIDGVSRTSVSATGKLPMTFMRMFGMGDYDVSVVATAEFQPHPLEVMVVLDNTGSMADTIDGTSKMASLKAAMHSFLNVLYQGSATQPDLAIGIINYTITTNVGDILKASNVPIESSDFTNRNWNAGDALGWKGCVADDETVNTMVDNVSTLEPSAYDIWPTLPGEKPRSDSPHDMLPVKPFFYPPMYFPKNTGSDKADGASDYYADGKNNTNMFMTAAADVGSAPALANTPLYKRYLYRMYKGLNNGAANMKDDVIVGIDGSSYYDTSAADAYDDTTGKGRDFYVRVGYIPNNTIFKPATHYDVVSGNTAQPSPNWQCPEPGIAVSYGLAKSVYDNFIDYKVWPVKPANGTMHHIGFLWGWRLLTRYDMFKRSPPAGAGKPRRALVFMTDGNTEFGASGAEADGRTFTAYGSPSEKVIATFKSSDSISTRFSNYASAAKTRFTKACAVANSTPMQDNGQTPMIFTVAINKGSSIGSDDSKRLRDCGTSGYYLTTSPAALNDAFTQIARTLTDVHLTR